MVVTAVLVPPATLPGVSLRRVEVGASSPGSPPSLPWPTTGSEALSMKGVGSLRHAGSTNRVTLIALLRVSGLEC